MKKTILKFIKSPAFDVFIFVVACLISLLLYILYCIPVYASPSSGFYYNSEGYVTYQTSNFNSERNYSESLGFNPTLIHNSNTSIPFGYVQVAYYVYAGPLYNDIRAVYGNPSSNYVFILRGDQCYLETSESSSMYIIENRVDSSGNLTFRSNSSSSRVGSGYCRISCLVDVYDSNGNLLSPIIDNGLIQMSTCGVSDGVSINIFQESHGGSLGSPVDVYLFPSDLPVDGGVVNNIITSPTYITELTPSEILGLQQNGFGNLLDTLQSNYNDYYDQYQGSWYSRGLPSIHFLAECQDTYTSTRFDPNSYGLPYALIDHFSSSKIFKINRSDFIGGSRVYAYDHLCILAVCHGENNDTIARYDFTPSLLSDGVTPPSQIHDQSHYIEPSVSDFQELADYLRYVIQVTDNNRDVEMRNQIAYLQSIPWSNYINAGVNSSLNGFLPRLSSEFDTMFNGLFTDFFVPDLEDIEAQVDEDEEAFSDKFQWVHDIKAEVNFIVHTPLAADDDEFVFKATIQKYSIGEVIFFDSEWIDGSTRTIVKRVITVFCTIALIVYIFKTLPSTLGNMPSD